MKVHESVGHVIVVRDERSPGIQPYRLLRRPFRRAGGFVVPKFFALEVKVEQKVASVRNFRDDRTEFADFFRKPELPGFGRIEDFGSGGEVFSG